MNIEIKKVQTKQDLKTFIRFNYEMYKNNPYSVPDLYEDMMDTFSPKKNPAFEFCEADYFLAYKDGKLAVMFDTEWKSGHQGAELYRLDTATGKFDISRTNVCSHSFGIDLITTDTGFVSIQKGDCYDRGLILQELTSAGRTSSNIAWHISGVYSEPGEHQNATVSRLHVSRSQSSTHIQVISP